MQILQKSLFNYKDRSTMTKMSPRISWRFLKILVLLLLSVFVANFDV